MKKTIKNIVLIVIMGLVLILLSGCGKNKLVATKTTSDEKLGNYTEETVITFKDDKINGVESTMEFEKEESAESMYSVYNMIFSMSEEEIEGMEIKKDGNKLIMTIDAKLYEQTAKAYAQTEGASEEEITKESLKATLEQQGYTVK